MADIDKSMLPSGLKPALVGAMVCFFGAVGGALGASTILANRDSWRIPREGIFAFFFFKPINGFAMAGAFYLAVLSGRVALFESGAGAAPSIPAVGLLAVLVGLFADDALSRLRAIGATMFGGRAEASAVKEG